MRKINVSIFCENGTVPKYQTELASGMDLHCDSENAITIPSMSARLISTGIFLRINEPGFEAQVRSRSGLAARYNIFVLNSPGTIDADYTGEIKIILYNASGVPFQVNPGDRIAQLVFCPVVQAILTEVKLTADLGNTIRGSGGFGHTGIEKISTVVEKINI